MRLRFLKPARLRTQPNAHVICDSVNSRGDRLTTMVVVMHRFVLAEFNTYRVFSRNSASSRAIPIWKIIQRVLEDPAIPLMWASEKPGMQGGEPVGWWSRQAALRLWLLLRLGAVGVAKVLIRLHVHKSVVNRILEPWMWQTVVVSSTEWDNFFDQRCSPLAQPEIRAAADAMYEALALSKPILLLSGEWHLPFIDEEDTISLNVTELKQCGAARCARVSTLGHDGKRNVDNDFKLFHRLNDADPIHASPFEHVATPDLELDHQTNFRGWRQMRYDLEHI